MPEDRAAPAPATDTVEAARAKMLAAVRPLTPEPVDIRAAIGRTLAETLQAARSQPPFRSSAMDGYGVRAADLAQSPFTVLGEARAGRESRCSPRATSSCRPAHPPPRIRSSTR